MTDLAITIARRIRPYTRKGDWIIISALLDIGFIAVVCWAWSNLPW